MRLISLLIGLFFTLSAFGQDSRMRELNELINENDPGWPIVKGWISNATNHVEVLPKDNTRADSALYQSQVTTRSPMGAVIYETGGILVESGWIRILGSGSDELNRSIMDWNKGKSFSEIGNPPSFLLIADDVLGGFYAINGGGIESKNIGKVYYFAPDTLTWENTGLGYSDFLIFCFQGDLQEFYKGLRWDNWVDDVSALDGNQGIFCYPYLWSEEGKDINKVRRKPVPVQELWDFYIANTHK
ncbi:DUF2625 domain-containing protein [Roseivirga sp. BDSF3-8]|uniref:DUF2625 domain-containing protein n=1 Tax=Roseivirga sp. BDSF3-8 TaxID=3241598 RepID=UPI00353220D4